MRRRALAAAGLVLVTTACSAGASAGQRQLTVLAAASLTETFRTLERRFEARHRDVDVTLAFDSSAALATQVVDGAPADVLATADERTMAQAVEAGVTNARPRVFAENALELVAPADNPAGLTGVEDLNKPGVAFLACVPTAPCGALAQRLLDHHAVTATPVSLEADVKAVLTKVVLGEADAGLVYRTDARAARNRVQRLSSAAPEESVTSYLVAPVGAGDGDLAEQFVDLLFSDDGRTVLRRAGFALPQKAA